MDNLLFDNIEFDNTIKDSELPSFFDSILFILESLSIAIYVSDKNGKTLFASNSYERITGINRNDVIGKHVTDIVNEGIINQSLVIMALSSKENPISMEVKYKGGRIVLATAYQIIDKNNEVKYIISFLSDIAKLKSIEKEKQVARDLLTNDRLNNKPADIIPINIIAESQQMKDVLYLAKKVAPFDTTVLISGETGVGKEVVADYIYKNSHLVNKPYVKINIASLPKNLIESELFGYVKGSFTGALDKGKTGFFELANGGTILLDEISELPYELQSVLLRVLQNKEIYRIGGDKPIKLDIRILASTNRNLLEEVHAGRFRKDLYYRFNFPIIIPSLRERKEDIIPLANDYLDKLEDKYHIKKHIHKDVNSAFENYNWPGNIRELFNLLNYLFITAKGDKIMLKDLPNQFFKNNKEETDVLDLSFKQKIEHYEAELIEEMMQEKLTIKEIAEKCELNPTTISRKINKYKLK